MNDGLSTPLFVMGIRKEDYIKQFTGLHHVLGYKDINAFTQPVVSASHLIKHVRRVFERTEAKRVWFWWNNIQEIYVRHGDKILREFPLNSGNDELFPTVLNEDTNATD